MPLQHSVEEVVLKNGVRGLIINIPDATVVSYKINFRAGNQYASSVEKQQTAHIMEHMVFGATKSIGSAEEFSRQFTKNGAYYNATTSQRNMTYKSEAAFMEWERILDLQKLAICEPLFNEDILTTEKSNVREELTANESSYGRLLWQRIYRDMGGPLLTDIEKKATIDEVTLDDINRHHALTHTTNNMRFCIAGNFKDYREKIIEAFENWQLPRGKELQVEQEVLSSAEPRKIFRKDTPSIEIALHIVLNREFSLEETIVMHRLNHILTGSFHSRIFGVARTRGLSYGLYSGTDTGPEKVTRWEISGQVSVKNAVELYKLVTEQLTLVAEGNISEDELKEAKEYALGDYQFMGQRVDDVCRWYASDYFDDLSIDTMTNRPEKIEKVSVDDMTRLAKEFLTEGEWAVGAVGTLDSDTLKSIQAELSPLFDAKVQ
jgi:predicted Zn-dependent peptidase